MQKRKRRRSTKNEPARRAPLPRVGWAPARSAGPAIANGRAKLVLMSHVQPRRIIINGHPTSVRLEPAYWGWLREIAAECGLTAKAFIEGVVAAKDPKCPLASALRLYIAHYFRSSAPRYGLVDPASRLAFRIERPRRSRKGSKKTEATVEIKPPVQDGINNPVVVRQDSNVSQRPNRRSCIPSRHSGAGSRRETCR